MNKTEWISKIRRACIEAETYKPFFDTVIDELARIMEIRDKAEEKFKAMGGEPVVEHTNKAGFTNVAKNPALTVITEQNPQALAYWRDLGLTPNGYKTLTGETIDEKKGGTLEAMLEKLEI